MSKANPIYPQARTWREIPQEVKPRAMSRGGRRRKLLTRGRIVGAVLATVVLVGGSFVFTELMRDDPGKISSAVNAVAVREVTLRTDGVLNHAWLLRTLALPAKASLLELDLGQLRQKLLADAQVSGATLTRKFPAALDVTITERMPVAQVNAQIGAAPPQALMVARDGTVFAGTGYAPEMLASLPYLAGIKLVRDGNRFQPIAGMDLVSDLLAKARNEAPELYQTWQVVSLARLESDGEIEVQSSTVAKIVFTTRSQDDFLHQLAQLDLLIDTAKSRSTAPLAEINLAVGRMADGRIQVPVTFASAPADAGNVPAAPAAPAAAPAPAPTVNPAPYQFFHPTRPTPREL